MNGAMNIPPLVSFAAITHPVICYCHGCCSTLMAVLQNKNLQHIWCSENLDLEIEHVCFTMLLIVPMVFGLLCVYFLMS